MSQLTFPMNTLIMVTYMYYSCWQGCRKVLSNLDESRKDTTDLTAGVADTVTLGECIDVIFGKKVTLKTSTDIIARTNSSTGKIEVVT